MKCNECKDGIVGYSQQEHSTAVNPIYCSKCNGTGEINDDPIRKPSHYMHGDLETKAIIKALLTPEEYRGYCKGNIIKYTDRAPYKGQTEQDYGKRKQYYDWLTEVE